MQMGIPTAATVKKYAAWPRASRPLSLVLIKRLAGLECLCFGARLVLSSDLGKGNPGVDGFKFSNTPCPTGLFTVSLEARTYFRDEPS